MSPPATVATGALRHGIDVSASELIALRASALEMMKQRRGNRDTQGANRQALFRGRGMDFEEVRAYSPGDDVRDMDWRATARTGRAHVKIYREERDAPVLLMVDQGPTMRFGTRVAFKSVVASRVAALLAWAAVEHGARVGGLVTSDNSHREIRPRARKSGALRLIHCLAGEHGDAHSEQPVSVNDGLEKLAAVARPGSAVIVISDFYEFDRRGELALATLAAHNDVSIAFVFDPMEVALPIGGVRAFGYAGQTVNADCRDPETRRAFENLFAGRKSRLETLCSRHGVQLIPVATDMDLQKTLRPVLNGHWKKS